MFSGVELAQFVRNSLGQFVRNCTHCRRLLGLISHDCSDKNNFYYKYIEWHRSSTTYLRETTEKKMYRSLETVSPKM